MTGSSDSGNGRSKQICVVFGASGGTVLRGMAVFRRAYDAVGLGWLLSPKNWPILKRVSDVCYAWFARNRRWLTR